MSMNFLTCFYFSSKAETSLFDVCCDVLFCSFAEEGLSLKIPNLLCFVFYLLFSNFHKSFIKLLC
jgi:hypothetical protein